MNISTETIETVTSGGLIPENLASGSLTSESLSQQLAQLIVVTTANTKAIATLAEHQTTTQAQVSTLRDCVMELRESQATALQQFCQEQQAASDEFRRLIDATLVRLEKTLDCMMADAENQGRLIQEIKDLSLRLMLGQNVSN